MVPNPSAIIRLKSDDGKSLSCEGHIETELKFTTARAYDLSFLPPAS